jgi:uncharacterized membrane protein
MDSRPTVRTVLRFTLVTLYTVAGIAHLVVPATFLPIVPTWVPYPKQVILITGVCELAGSVGLLTRRWRPVAGVMLAIYAVCVFPANVKHAIEGIPLPPVPDSWWYHGPRLALQPVLVWAALFCSNVINWPTRRIR